MDLAMPCLWFGMPVVAHRAGRSSTPRRAWRLMAEERVTCAFLPPAALRADATRAGARGSAPARRHVGRRGAGRGPDGMGAGRAWACRSTRSTARPNATSSSRPVTGTQAGRAPGTLGRPVPGDGGGGAATATAHRRPRARWARYASAARRRRSCATGTSPEADRRQMARTAGCAPAIWARRCRAGPSATMRATTTSSIRPATGSARPRSRPA